MQNAIALFMRRSTGSRRRFRTFAAGLLPRAACKLPAGGQRYGRRVRIIECRAGRGYSRG
jgi:hypothetical protein